AKFPVRAVARIAVDSCQLVPQPAVLVEQHGENSHKCPFKSGVMIWPTRAYTHFSSDFLRSDWNLTSTGRAQARARFAPQTPHPRVGGAGTFSRVQDLAHHSPCTRRMRCFSPERRRIAR